MPAPDTYLLGHRPREQTRLQRQAEQLAGDADWLLDRLGPLEGRRVVEIGCGPRGYLDALSARVGPRGSVVGVEPSDEAIALARALVSERQLANVELLHGDGRATLLPGADFNVAVARLVLVNVPRPEELVGEAVRLVRRGGTVAFHEADWATLVCDPPLPAWDRAVALLQRYAALNGIDLAVGRRLPRLLREAGLVDVRSRPIVGFHEPGSDRRSILPDFVDNLAERLVAHGLTTARELNELQEGLQLHVADPDTLVISHLFVQAWGRKPLNLAASAPTSLARARAAQPA